MRFVATALLLCAALTAETAAQTRYSTQGMRVDGTICVDAATGAVLAQTTADYPGSPASVTKLMTLLLVLEDVRAGKMLELEVDESVSDADLETMAKQLLANMVIENYRIERIAA